MGQTGTRERLKNSRGSQGGWLTVLADFQEPQPTRLPNCRMHQGSGPRLAFRTREEESEPTQAVMSHEGTRTPTRMHLTSVLFQRDLISARGSLQVTAERE